MLQNYRISYTDSTTESFRLSGGIPDNSRRVASLLRKAIKDKLYYRDGLFENRLTGSDGNISIAGADEKSLSQGICQFANTYLYIFIAAHACPGRANIGDLDARKTAVFEHSHIIVKLLVRKQQDIVFLAGGIVKKDTAAVVASKSGCCGNL